MPEHPSEATKHSPEAELAAIKELLLRMPRDISALTKNTPGLTIVSDLLHHALPPNEDTVNTLQVSQSMVQAMESVIRQLQNVVNPTGLPLEATPDGRILSRTFRSAAVIATDLEGSTPMAADIPRVWDTIPFDVLSYTYYPHLMEVLRKYNCHLYSFSGDGTLIMSREALDPKGRVLLPALDNAVLCVAEAHLVLDAVAETWKELGMHGPEGKPIRTRFGVKLGSVTFGDALAPDGNPRGMCADFNERFKKVIADRIPQYGPPEDFSMKFWGIHGISPAQNEAARLQNAGKKCPDKICTLTAEDMQQLCSPLQKLFSRIPGVVMQGYEADVWGMEEVQADDLGRLAHDCKQFYQDHETYH
ncbi:hypothetical protein HYZ99_01795 [Candidatus Peregrinibacteria bacterium]|nr:hypothetical protein [Candidatus Peregrinibacteria bacterium]